MSRESITLSYKQLGAIALVLVNILLAGPGGWMLNHLWSETQKFRTETETQLDELEKQLNQLHIDLSEKYVTRKAFSDYREQMGETIRHLDSKITP
ncbi:MAG: hypothetical protein OXC41_00090 [Gammaproteobacteria bacterium]|nr:hypothetical protein [Gammaproteobacteria bacterium]